jgi:hypothetical protein
MEPHYDVMLASDPEAMPADRPHDLHHILAWAAGSPGGGTAAPLRAQLDAATCAAFGLFPVALVTL